MSEHKRAVEWEALQQKSEANGWKPKWGFVASVISNLAACEAERNDLRRKLEETDARAYAVLSAYGVPKDRAGSVANGIGVLAQRFNRALSDASLANAAARTALQNLEWSDRWLDDENRQDLRFETCPVCRWKRQDGHSAECELGAALALPADGLAGEVRWVLKDYEDGPIVAKRQWIARRDALLAKLGARP